MANPSSKSGRGKSGRSKGLGLSALKAVQAGRRSAEVDLKVEAENAKREGAAHLLPLSMIKPRPAEDTRPVHPEHVASLVESIRVLGLLQPIYIDRDYHLIAGAHRFSAYQQLYAEDPKQWAKIPVVVDPDLSASSDPERALLKEIAENEKRRNLTAEEVQMAARRLMEADTTFTRRPGRLRAGERALTPFLATTFGVSIRHLRSLLNEELDGPPKPEPTLEERRVKFKRKMKRQLKKWRTDSLISEDLKLIALLDAIEREL